PPHSTTQGSPNDSQQLIDWTEANNLVLLNEPGLPTHDKGNTIDLTWANPWGYMITSNWYIDDDTFYSGSDHAAIVIEISPSLQYPPPPPSDCFNYSKADWEGITKSFRECLPSLMAAKSAANTRVRLRQNSCAAIEDVAKRLT